jgi:short-subunit dehydrogenase
MTTPASTRTKNPRTILITGATTGIGRHAALHLAKDGHRVIATGRNTAALAALAEEAGKDGTSLHTLRLDVTDAVSVMAAHAEVLERTGGAGVDVLVNNAGYGLSGPLEEVSDSDLRAQFDTNVFGLMAVTRAFLPEMRARGAGRIINIGSIGGRMAMPFMGAYSATKFAVESLSDALRIELSSAGVDVVLVEPGPIKTEFSGTAASFVDKYRRPDSPYADVLVRAKEIQDRSDKMSVGPEVITNVLRKAIAARRPAARYVAPFSSLLLLRVILLMPTPISDWIARAILGLHRKALPAGKPDSPRLPA